MRIITTIGQISDVEKCNNMVRASYNTEIIFYLNLKKTVGIMASGLGYFTLLNSFFTLPAVQVFAQQKDNAHLNFISRTSPVHLNLSQKTSSAALFQLNSDYTEISRTLVADDCGEGGSAYNPPATPSTEPGGSVVSPNTKVLNPQLAYDSSESTYSTIYMDQQQKGVELSQYILFSNPGTASDQVRLKMSLTGDLLNDNDYTVTLQGFMGSTAVGSAINITTGLTNDQFQYFITPGATFDRIKINILTNTNGNKKAQVNVHYVTLIAPPPVFPGSTTINGQTSSSAVQCEGSVALNVASPDPNYIYKWYDASNTYLATGTTYAPALADGTYVFYVEAARGATCPSSSKHKINLTVKPKPVTPAISLN